MFGDFATLVSSFTGADENPLSEGGVWADLDGSTTQVLRRLSNQVACTGVATGDKYHNALTFGPDCEAYMTVPVLPVTTDQVTLCLRVQSPGSTSWDGYRVAVNGSGDLELGITTNNSNTQLALTTGAVSAGDKIGIRCIGTTIQSWKFTGGVWSMVDQVTDATYQSSGRLGLRIRGTTGRIDDVEAGTIVWETATVSLVLTPSTSDSEDAVDSGTVRELLTPSGVEVPPATIYTDSDSVYLDISCGDVDLEASVDSTTVNLTLSVQGGECYSTAILAPEGEASKRWSSFMGIEFDGDAFDRFDANVTVQDTKC